MNQPAKTTAVDDAREPIPSANLLKICEQRLRATIGVSERYLAERDALQSMVRGLARTLIAIGDGAFSHDYSWIVEQANAGLSHIPKELR